MAQQSVGGLFQYTNRSSDLTEVALWTPDQPWDQHYTGAGFEDRDHELEDYLGSGITTRRLVLVNSAGRIVAELATGSDASAFPLSPVYAGLEMLHLDPLTSDSSLRWTQSTSGNEYVALTGPGTAGAATANRPRIFLRRTQAGPQTYVEVSSGRADGAAAALTPTIQLGNTNGATRFARIESGPDSLDLRDATGATLSGGPIVLQAAGGGAANFINTSADALPLTDTAGTTRGALMGARAGHVGLGANTNLTVAGVVLCTVNLANMPNSSGLIWVSGTICCQANVAGDGFALGINLNGVPALLASPYLQWNAADMAGSFDTLHVSAVVAPVAGTHTLTLVGATATINNSFTAIAGRTSLETIYFS